MKKVNRALRALRTRRDPDSGYTLRGVWFDDPYAWLEDELAFSCWALDITPPLPGDAPAAR